MRPMKEFLYNIVPENPPVCFTKECRYGAALRSATGAILENMTEEVFLTEWAR